MFNIEKRLDDSEVMRTDLMMAVGAARDEQGFAKKVLVIRRSRKRPWMDCRGDHIKFRIGKFEHSQTVYGIIVGLWLIGIYIGPFDGRKSYREKPALPHSV